MENLIIVRGGGDLATGTIYKLKKCGFPVLILEVANPSAIRRNVAFCEAVYQGTQTVEDLTTYSLSSRSQMQLFLVLLPLRGNFNENFVKISFVNFGFGTPFANKLIVKRKLV